MLRNTQMIGRALARMIPDHKRYSLVLLFVALSAGSARAQNITGDVFGGLGLYKCCGGSTTAVNVGAGVDRPLGRLLALNTEFGILDATGDGVIQTAMGSVIFGRVKVFSVDALVHFDISARWMIPFLNAGVDLIAARDAAGANANLGGGFDWWVDERRGVRIEVRDDLFRVFGTTHVILVRAGVIFR